MTHICISILTIIGSDNGLLPGDWRQAIIWTDAGILLIGPLGTNFSEILIVIHAFSFKKMHLKMSSGKWRPFCLGLKVLTTIIMCSICLVMMPGNARSLATVMDLTISKHWKPLCNTWTYKYTILNYLYAGVMPRSITNIFHSLVHST